MCGGKGLPLLTQNTPTVRVAAGASDPGLYGERVRIPAGIHQLLPELFLARLERLARKTQRDPSLPETRRAAGRGNLPR